MTTRLATCSCGQLTARCVGEPALISLCHCKSCQRRTGSAFGVGAFFLRTSVEAAGERRNFTRQGDSGSSVKFHFCPACGSTVFWEPERRPDIVAVAVGTFADSNFPKPTREVYTSERCIWIDPFLPEQPAP